MDMLSVLRKEESKLLAVSEKVGEKLSQIRAAINAMSGNGRPSAGRVSKLGKEVVGGASRGNQSGMGEAQEAGEGRVNG
jgi:hypothetical protein